MDSAQIKNMFIHVENLLTKPPITTEENFLEYIKDQYKIDKAIFAYEVIINHECHINLIDLFSHNIKIASRALDYALEKKAVIKPRMLHRVVNIDLDIASKLINIAKLDVNVKNTFGNTPLHLAENEQAINFLMKRGASFFVKNNKGYTAIETIHDEKALKALHKNISSRKKEEQSKALAFGVAGITLITTAMIASGVAIYKIKGIYEFAKNLSAKILGANSTKFLAIACGTAIGAGAILTAVAGKKIHDIKTNGYTEALDKINSKLPSAQEK